MNHRRSNSTKILKNPSSLILKNLPAKQPKEIKIRPTSTRVRKTYINTNRHLDPASKIKNIDFILSTCQKEQKKIRKISEKLKISKKKMVQNNQLLSNLIQRPLYSLKFLKKLKPEFLNRNLKYQ